MATSNNLGDLLTSIANAIRAKGGTTASINAQAFPSAIMNLPSGGGAEDELVTRTISIYENSRVSTIGSYAFNSCSKLTTALFPKVTSIEDYAFGYCFKLTTISFPSVTSIGTSAFNHCSSLTTISFPKVTYIGSYAFTSCSKLTTASFPNVTSIGNYAFANCSKLTTASFPNVTSIGNYAFYRCSSLTTISFPKVTYIGNYAFISCSKLMTAYFLTSTVPTLSGTSTFYYTNLQSIYVKSSLAASFKTATNWASLSSKIIGM